MMTDRDLDKTISDWLEAEAPRQLPDRVLTATFEQTRHIRQQGSWPRILARRPVGATMNALSAAAVVVLVVSVAAAAFALGPRWSFVSPGNSPTSSASAGPTPAPSDPASPAPTDPPSPAPTDSPSPAPTPSLAPAGFVGRWLGTDPPPESSHLTLDVVALADGGYEITLHDDAAAVCGGVAWTMTGVAQEANPNTILIARPSFGCDDGSKPHSLNGDRLKDLLRNYTLIYDAEQDELQEPSGFIWTRAGAEQ
jgi:hypothetical protein